jgi:hypothetical protein
MLVVALATVCVRRGSAEAGRERWAVGAGLILMTALVDQSFLRANLAERFGDAAPAVALVSAWTAGTASLWSTGLGRRIVLTAVTALLFVSVAANVALADIRRELDTAGLSDSPQEAVRRYREVREELVHMPPAAWTGDGVPGTLRAARYLAECTRPTDRVLLIGPVHEVAVFARRRFAAGQPLFKLSLYTSERFQQLALARLAHQSVPLVVADVEELGVFRALYPLVARLVAERYNDAGGIAIDGVERFRVLAAADWRPTRRDPDLGLPCFVDGNREIEWQLPRDAFEASASRPEP